MPPKHVSNRYRNPTTQPPPQRLACWSLLPATGLHGGPTTLKWSICTKYVIRTRSGPVGVGFERFPCRVRCLGWSWADANLTRDSFGPWGLKVAAVRHQKGVRGPKVTGYRIWGRRIIHLPPSLCSRYRFVSPPPLPLPACCYLELQTGPSPCLFLLQAGRPMCSTITCTTPRSLGSQVVSPSALCLHPSTSMV